MAIEEMKIDLFARKYVNVRKIAHGIPEFAAPALSSPTLELNTRFFSIFPI